MHGTAGTRWLRSLGVAVLLLAATACSGSPPPAGAVETPTPSVRSSTPSPTATPVEQQVEAAVRAYYAEIVKAARSNDTSRLRTMVAASCPCFRTVTVINRNRREGQRTPTLAIELQSVSVHDVIADSASAEVTTRDTGYDVLSRSGQVIEHIPEAKTHLDLSLVRSKSDVWVVANFFNLDG
jgi:hypothetical protein